MDLGPHATFIVAAYGVTALILGALILRAVVHHRAQMRALVDLEGRGVRRRSDQADASLARVDTAAPKGNEA